MGRSQRAGPPDEKVTINLGPVDVGHIDLLVEEGFYGSRTDFIRTAVRNLLEERKDSIDEAVSRFAETSTGSSRDVPSVCIGVMHMNRGALEGVRKMKKRLKIRVIGVLRIGGDVTPDLADEAIHSIRVLGHFSAPAAVRKRLEPKMVRGGQA
jgi:Arc/MetJ-type ribon-helix-helix transcriptional regulator